MFVEPTTTGMHTQTGWIEVICGCMFSGKTEELIRRLKRAIIAKQRVKVFKPSIDTRYHKDYIISHNQAQIESVATDDAEHIIGLAGNYEVIGIDEAQFFDDNIVDVAVQLANLGKRVIVAGLDMDFRGKPFGPMPNLLAVAEYVTKLHAICALSGVPASFSYRLDDTPERTRLGAQETYQARSRYYFFRDLSDE